MHHRLRSKACALEDVLLEHDEPLDRGMDPGMQVTELIRRLEQGDEATATLLDTLEEAVELGFALLGGTPFVDGVLDLHRVKSRWLRSRPSRTSAMRRSGSVSAGMTARQRVTWGL
jgi:hypothetical protein